LEKDTNKDEVLYNTANAKNPRETKKWVIMITKK
jgi:hypothetical protein